MQKTKKNIRSYAKIFQIKSSKIISLLIIFLLLSTVATSAVSSYTTNFDNENDEISEESNALIKQLIQAKSIKEKIQILKEKLQILRNKLSSLKNTETTDDPNQSSTPMDSRLKLINMIKDFMRLKQTASNLKFYTNYNGTETVTDLKLFRTVFIDVNFDGKEDIKVKLRLYPWIEKNPLSISANFKVIISREAGFPDITENFSGYFEIYFPGSINKNMLGDRVRIGYESPKGEEVPAECTLSYMYQSYIFRPKYRPAHTFSIDPKVAKSDTKLVLLFSYTNFQGGNISSELISRTIFNPAAASTIKLSGTGPLGGTSYEFSRTISDKSKVDLICSFLKNGTTLYGYAYDMPKKITFTIDTGKEGYIEYNTYGERATEVGLCDDLYNPVNRVFFSRLPDYAVLEWDRRLLLDQKVFLRGHANGTGVAINGHLEGANNSTYDFSLFSNEPIRFNVELDTRINRLIIDKTDIDLSFDFKGKGQNGSYFNLSFDLKRHYTRPFEIYYGKLTDKEMEFKFYSEKLQINNLDLEVNLSKMELAMKADKILKNNSGNATLRLRVDKQDKNITFNITMIVENSLELYNFSVGFNGLWIKPIDIILEGTVTRYFEITIEAYDFEYFIADDWSWGYFHFKGSISYQAYRNFKINGISGAYKGKIYAGTSEEGLNISWYTDASKGYPVKKLSVTGFIFGLEDFHFYYGEIFNFYVPKINGGIDIVDICNESGYVGIRLDGDPGYFNLNLSFNNTDGQSNTNISTMQIGALFTLCDNLSVDIYWDKSEQYVELISSIDTGLSIDNFYFNVDDKIEIYWDKVLFNEGNFSFLFNNATKKLGLILEGLTFHLENLECKFNLNKTIAMNIGSLTLSEGKISIDTIPGSHVWNIQTLKDIDDFELVDFDFSIDNLEGGIGLIRWDRTTEANFFATLDLSSEEFKLEIERNCDYESEFTVENAYIRYTLPNINFTIGGRLRSLTLLYQKSSNDYFYLECKKNESVNLDVDFAANWNLTFERFFDIMNYLSTFEMLGSSAEGNFSMHYVPPADNDSAHFLELSINELTKLNMLELKYRSSSEVDKILSIGSLEIQPGTIVFEAMFNENTSGGWLHIFNNNQDCELEEINFEAGDKTTAINDLKISQGDIFIYGDLKENALYILNNATVNFTLLSVKESSNLVKIEKEDEVGIISMQPGEFLIEWCNLTGEEYDKQFNISNGVFEITLAKVSLNIYGLEFSISLGDTVRDFTNEITIKLRLRGNKNRAIFVNTQKTIQFDAFKFAVSAPNWYLELDLLEITVKLDELYIGYFEGNLSHGGNISFGINRFFNLTYGWKNETSPENKLFLQYEKDYSGNQQAQAIVLDTQDCYEDLAINFNDIKINGINLDGTLTIKSQKYMRAHFDFDPSPRGNQNIIDGHLFLDTDNQNMGDLDIVLTKYVNIFGNNVKVGLKANLEFLKAQDFHISGSFIYLYIDILGIYAYVPYDWSLSGSIDIITVGEMSLIYKENVVQIWPCKPVARLNKYEYGVTNQHKIVEFNTSRSTGFLTFPISHMRWDWDGDGSWDTGNEITGNWISYPQNGIVTHDFTQFLNSGEDSVQVAFQVRTRLFITSDITYATIKVGDDYKIEILYEGDYLFEFEYFEVRVLDFNTNQPISGATVQYLSYDDSGNPTLVAVNTTNILGKAGFIAVEVPDNDADRQIRCRAYVEEKDDYLASYSDLFIVWDSLTDIHGHIKDLVTGQYLSGVLITAEPGGYSCLTPPNPTSPFHLYVPAGTYTINASKQGYFDKTLIENLVIEEDQIHYNLGFCYLGSTSYGGLRGTVYDAVTGERRSGVTVTVIIPGGDNLVSTTGFPSGRFPMSPYPYPSFKLNPGTYTVTFTRNEYYSYSQDVQINAGEVLDISVYMQPEWVSPDGYSDTNSGWSDEPKSYDNSLTTYAYSKRLYYFQSWQWSEYLTLTLSNPVSCDKIRFYALYHADYINKIRLDVYYNGNWHFVYEGAFSNLAWVEKSLGGTYSVAKARVRFYYKGCLTGTTADLYELGFHNIITYNRD